MTSDTASSRPDLLDDTVGGIVALAAADGAERLFTTAEVSAQTGRSCQTLRTDRMNNVGIPYVRVGPRQIRYRKADVDGYLARNSVRPTVFDGAFRLAFAA